MIGSRRLAAYDPNIVDQSRSEANFLALDVLFSQLPQQGQKYTILDMGAANHAKIEFFSTLKCRLFVEDFFRFYTERLAHAKREKNVLDPQHSLTCLQKYPAETSFDLVLFWDLFDYIQPADLQALLKHLSGYCKRGTVLFFLTSALEHIPIEPAVFRIIDKQHLSYENKSPTTRRAVGYTQTSLRKILTGFKLYRGFRMSTGQEEHVFIKE
ncbi:MAG: methyltransferase domain-containing protein [Pseudomonadota bacterium]